MSIDMLRLTFFWRTLARDPEALFALLLMVCVMMAVSALFVPIA
jgi:hypothetical protein